MTKTEKTEAAAAAASRRRLCKVDGCTKIVKSQGLCQRHGAKTRLCKVKGCPKQAQGNFDGMCKFHFKESRVDLKESNDRCIPTSSSSRHPEPVGQSVYDTILPASLEFREANGNNSNGTTQRLMPLVAHLKKGFDENRPRGWHRNDERRARGLFPIAKAAEQLQGWERELVWMEICILSGNRHASFRHLARAWGRDKGFHMVLAQFICMRRGNVERKKRPKKRRQQQNQQPRNRRGSSNVVAARKNGGSCRDTNNSYYPDNSISSGPDTGDVDHDVGGDGQCFMDDILSLEDMDLPIDEIFANYADDFAATPSSDDDSEQMGSVSQETELEEAALSGQSQAMGQNQVKQQSAVAAMPAKTPPPIPVEPQLMHPVSQQMEQGLPLPQGKSIGEPQFEQSAAVAMPPPPPLPSPLPPPSHVPSPPVQSQLTNVTSQQPREEDALQQNQEIVEPSHLAVALPQAQCHVNALPVEPQQQMDSVSQQAECEGGLLDQCQGIGHAQQARQPVAVAMPPPQQHGLVAAALSVEPQPIDSASHETEHEEALKQNHVVGEHQQAGYPPTVADMTMPPQGLVHPSLPVEQPHHHDDNDDDGFIDPLDEHLLMPVQDNPTEEPLTMKLK